jgi:ABC-type transport system involved in multi-copper enzyme maturation permease subunit
MLKVLLKRQLIEDILTSRFYISLVLIFGAVCAFALVFADHFQKSQDSYLKVMAQNDRYLQQFAKSPKEHLNSSIQSFMLKPKPELFISEAYEGNIPQGFLYEPYMYSVELLSLKEEVSAAQHYRFVSKKENLADVLTYSPDLTFIVQVLLSFLALILTFGAVTAEKEKGTLRLIYSNPAKRAYFILAKYLSALFTVGISLFIGLILSLILLNVLSAVPLSSSLISSYSLFFLVSIIYLSVFILLGILCSVLSHRSKNSLVLCLLIWVFLVIVFPKSTGMLLTLKRFDVPTEEEIYQLAQKASIETEDRLEKQLPPDWSRKYYEKYRLNELLLKFQFESDKSKQDTLDYYLRKKLSAVGAARRVNFLSPASLFEYSSSSVSGTGLFHFENLWTEIRRYEDDFLSFVKNEGSVLEKGAFFYLNYDTISDKPLDFNAIPKFEDKNPKSSERLKDALPYVGLLLLYNLLLFVVVFYKFQTYDVR